jgi:DNA repair protein RecN (Recombination protein N)
MDARERTARLDLLAFQLGELDKVAPSPGEDEALATTRQVLASAEKVQRLCQDGYAALYENDGAVLTGLGGVWKRVAELAAIEPRFAPYVDARDDIKGQLEDLAFFLRDYGDGVDASPSRLQEVEDRLAALERIKRKYGPTLDDAIERRASLAAERDLLLTDADRPEALGRALQEATTCYLAAARDLSRRRKAAAPSFATRLVELLAGVAMPGSRFEVRFGPESTPDEWGERGIDRAEFFLSPNPGEDLRPLARIASGGELSRIMLALKTLGRTPGRTALPGYGKTLIFDEVDSGIGGAVATVVGERLYSLADRFQVLCITHLPQIAVQGGTHYRIQKGVRGGRTATSVESLIGEARVAEIGRMIGGAAITESVRATARELLGPAAARKAKGESESPGRRRRS